MYEDTSYAFTAAQNVEGTENVVPYGTPPVRFRNHTYVEHTEDDDVLTSDR